MDNTVPSWDEILRMRRENERLIAENKNLQTRLDILEQLVVAEDKSEAELLAAYGHDEELTWRLWGQITRGVGRALGSWKEYVAKHGR